MRQAQAAVTEAENAARAADDALTVAREAPRPMLDASAREGMLGALEAARDAEMRARLDVETLKERVRAGKRVSSSWSVSVSENVPPQKKPHDGR